MESLALETPDGPVPARIEGEGVVGILLATGAGTGHDHPGVAGLSTRLAAAGATVMTFEYAYRAAGRRFPDPPAKLLAVHRAAAEHLRRRVGGELVLAGRSMGGRMSTMLTAEGEPCAGVVAYGYPLHPPGRPERLRVEHLTKVGVPLLLITGSNDSLARRDLVELHLAPLPMARVVWVEGANHSFHRKGTKPEEMLDHLANITIEWISGLSGLTGTPMA